MAIAFFRVNERSQNAASKYDYDTRTGRYEGGDLVASGAQNLPSWAQELPRGFWVEADKNEKGNKCKTIIIALPQELNNDELKSLAQEACAQLFQGHATTWAIHRPKGRLSGEDNPHLHVMVCERLIDSSRPDLAPEQYFKKTRTRKDGTLSGGYAKDTRMTKTDRRQWLQETKEAWEAIANRHLQQHADRKNRHRDFGEEEQAAQLHFPAREMEQKKRKKSIHLGPKVMVRMLKGQPTKIGARWIDQSVTPIMQELGRAYDRAKIDNTTGVEPWHYIWACMRHPQNKEKRRRMLIDYRMQDAEGIEPDRIRWDMQHADDAAAEALRPQIKQLRKLAQWGRENNVGDGILHFYGRWRKDFAELADHLIAIDVRRAKEAERKAREKARAERQAAWEEAERKEKEIAARKAKEKAEEERKALQQKAQQTPRPAVRNPKPEVIVVHYESRGRGRSR